MSAPFSRILLRPQWSKYTCDACYRSRCLSTSAQVQSGHSKWASIKHDKGKKDASINKQRNIFARDLAMASKIGGPDPRMNPRLALAITNAKKAGSPKAMIEAAINRGQGISASGAALETVILEVLLPYGVACIIDCQTDSKARMMLEIQEKVKKNNATQGSVAYMFRRRGIVIFKAKKKLEGDEVLNAALEAGVEDVEENDDGTVIVYTEPVETKAAADSIAAAVDLEIEETDIIYDPNEDTMVPLPNEKAANELGQIIDQLKETQGVKAIYANAQQGELEDGVWAEFMSRLDI